VASVVKDARGWLAPTTPRLVALLEFSVKPKAPSTAPSDIPPFAVIATAAPSVTSLDVEKEPPPRDTAPFRVTPPEAVRPRFALVPLTAPSDIPPFAVIVVAPPSVTALAVENEPVPRDTVPFRVTPPEAVRPRFALVPLTLPKLIPGAVSVEAPVRVTAFGLKSIAVVVVTSAASDIVPVVDTDSVPIFIGPFRMASPPTERIPEPVILALD
jgi:hypothetical protein